MDVETLAVALKKSLPQADSGDAGAVLVVDENGKWAKGMVIPDTVISVSGTTLVVTAAE